MRAIAHDIVSLDNEHGMVHYARRYQRCALMFGTIIRVYQTVT